MKSSLGLSWNQHRRQKCYLTRILGVHCESEKKERLERSKILANYLETKQITVIERNDKSHDSKGGLTETSAPVVHVKNLKKFVKDLLDGYKQNGKLLWRDGMPKNELWVKIGGDQGGNSFKLCLQVCNLDKPNSKKNNSICLYVCQRYL